MRLLSFMLLLLCFFAIPSLAGELPDYEEYLPNEVTQALSAEWLVAFGLGDGNASGALQTKLETIFRVQLKEALEAGTLLFGMLILVSICSQYALSLNGGAASNAVQLASLCCFGISGYGLLYDVWTAVGQALGAMETIIAAITPSITALTLAGGNVTTAGIYGAGASWLIAGMGAMLTDLLYPVMHLCYGILLVGGISAEDPLAEMAKWIRRILVSVLTTGMGILALVLSVQSAIAQSADSVTAKTMKFALGNSIPFVGAAVGESVRTVTASLSYLRSAVGGAALVALVATLLPVLLNICFYKGVFSLIGQLANVVGSKNEGKILCGISDILNIALAILVSCFVCSIVLFALFAKTTIAFA